MLKKKKIRDREKIPVKQLMLSKNSVVATCILMVTMSFMSLKSS